MKIAQRMTARKQTRKKSPSGRKTSGVGTWPEDARYRNSSDVAPENRRKTGASFGVTVPPEVGRATQWQPGQSGNPGGRPKSHGLLEVLRTAVDETVAKALVEVLIAEALKGRNPLPAIQTIFDRLEGRPKQAIDFNDITDAMKDRSPEDLLHYAQTGHWLEDENAADTSEVQQHES